MITTKVDSVLPEFDLDLNQVAVSVRGSSDPQLSSKVDNSVVCPSSRLLLTFRSGSGSFGAFSRRPDLP
jgi:hypothetical protein